MRYVKWSVLGLLSLIVILFLAYTLPQRDIVRVVNTEVRRVDLSGTTRLFWASADSGSDTTLTNRDIRFIETIRANGRPVVYRNEDTGWGWPPYFKLDSANLQAIARDLVSDRDTPRWVAVRHYGMRSELFSVFPNALGVREVAGPGVRLIPWGNIVFLTVVAALLFLAWRRLRRLWRPRPDPLIADAAAPRGRFPWQRSKDRGRG
jgi:hypothetical protein